MTEPWRDFEPSEPGTLRTVMITLAASLAARRSSSIPPLRSTLASPQSTSCTSPKAPTITLAGFRSRWMTPRECA
jgi:hypothetical protein